MSERKLMIEIEENKRYVSPNLDFVMQREWDTKSLWVLRSGLGTFIDKGQYRNDIAERHGFDLVHWEELDNVGKQKG